MKSIKYIVKQVLMLVTISGVIVSCSTDDEKLNSDEELSKTELKTILETDEIAGVADNVLSQLYMGKNNPSGKVEECYSATYTDTGFTAVFENCNLNGTQNVNGTLSVQYATEEGSAAFTATYTDFYVGTIKLNGSRGFVLTTDEDEGSISLTIASNMSVQMEDGSIVAESGTKTLVINLETAIFSITGNWTLEVDGDTYKVVVGTALSGNVGCDYLNKGSMTVEKNGLIVSVDFGDGTCDDIAQLTYPNGATEELTLKD
ncbi:MAG: hypothetical protein WBM83_05580 [Flavobacteriaceae bacterium]